MKKIFLLLICVPVFFGFNKKDTYTIRGTLTGKSEGVKIYLELAEGWPMKKLDSAIIRNGTFTFKGSVSVPRYCNISIKRKVSEKGSSYIMSSQSYLFVENSEITFRANIDSLTYDYLTIGGKKEAVIRGSKTNDLYSNYLTTIKPYTDNQKILFDKYLKTYHQPYLKGVYNFKEGIGIFRAQDSIKALIESTRWKFIKENNNSVVAIKLAKELFEDRYINVTSDQVNEITNIIDPSLRDSEPMKMMLKQISKVKQLAIGNPYPDIKLKTIDGKTVSLSEIIPKGKYVMLEFWASWCGPCRGEIPHLRKVYELYKNKGFEIISISLDQKDADWKKALKEEKMTWTQLCDPLDMKGPAAKQYNIAGVPHCILIDPQGRCFKTEMRGANLDALLVELYGNLLY